MLFKNTVFTVNKKIFGRSKVVKFLKENNELLSE